MLVRKLLSFFCGHFPGTFIGLDQVDFVADEDDDDVRLSMILELVKPLLDV